MKNSDLLDLLTDMDLDADIHIVVNEDDDVYSEIVNVESDGVGAIEIKVV